MMRFHPALTPRKAALMAQNMMELQTDHKHLQKCQFLRSTKKKLPQVHMGNLFVLERILAVWI